MRAVLPLFLLSAACNDPGPAGPFVEVAVVCADGLDACSFDFGTCDVSVLVTKEIALTNRSDLPLTFLDVDLIGDPAFDVDNRPDVLAPNGTHALVVSVRPNVVASVETTLYILSDAQNDVTLTEEGLSLVEIPMRVTGVDNGIPDIAVEQRACDFGTVEVGDEARCDLAIENDGNRELVVDEIRLPCGPGCPFSTSIADASSIPAGTAVTMTVTFAPATAEEFNMELQILSSDPDENVMVVELTGVGIAP